jgi:predicted kinase
MGIQMAASSRIWCGSERTVRIEELQKTVLAGQLLGVVIDVVNLERQRRHDLIELCREFGLAGRADVNVG